MYYAQTGPVPIKLSTLRCLEKKPFFDQHPLLGPPPTTGATLHLWGHPPLLGPPSHLGPLCPVLAKTYLGAECDL